MAFVYEIIKDAYREANLIPITQSPTLDESTEALRLLNRFVKSVYGTEAGEPLRALSVGATNCGQGVLSGTLAPVNSRLMLNLSTALTLAFSSTPGDGSRMGVIDEGGNLSTTPLTLSGNGLLIDGAATVVLNTNHINKEWFYRADLGSWTTVSELSLTDVFPFPEEFDDYFTLTLATRLNGRNGAALSPESVENMRRNRSQFVARYSQRHEACSEEALLRLGNYKYYLNDFPTGK